VGWLMKTFLVVLCSVFLAFGLTACGKGKAPVGKGKAPAPVVTKG
jgi:hypothetical protein